MATRTRCTPRSVGTGEEAEEEDGSFLERPSSSSKPDKGDGVCLVCALGTKGSHTYRQECKRYVAGATLEQMQKAACGGRKGHSRLLLELALQRKDEEQKKGNKPGRSPLEGKWYRRPVRAAEALRHEERLTKRKEKRQSCNGKRESRPRKQL